MDTDEEGEESSSRPRSPARRRRRDEDDDDDDVSGGGGGERHPTGEDLSHRIVELRTPSSEANDPRPSSSGVSRRGMTFLILASFCVPI